MCSVEFSYFLHLFLVAWPCYKDTFAQLHRKKGREFMSISKFKAKT
jgi:hypothetical protein